MSPASCSSNDVLVVQTGCGAIASAKLGLLTGEAGLDQVGPGLQEICEAIGIPPVLHMGSCVDNTRILTVLTQMVEEGGLGDDIDQIPAVGLAPEWMSEKALAIGTYCCCFWRLCHFRRFISDQRHARPGCWQRQRSTLYERGLGKVVWRQDGVYRRPG